MTIDDYIKKHGLTLWRTWPTPPNLYGPWTPAVFLSYEQNGKTIDFEHGEKIDIYANTDKTLFVAMNVTRGLFRIVHHELLVLYSPWERINVNYQVDPIM
jgi:hypothetical protein